MIIRVSVPYSGASEYLTMLLPAALFSFLAALACALVVSKRFVDSVTQPLSNIAAEMSKVKGDYKGDYTELHFEKCQYPELNVIAETTMETSKNVKAYLSCIDKEKQIRQEFFSNASHELKNAADRDYGQCRAFAGAVCRHIGRGGQVDGACEPGVQGNALPGGKSPASGQERFLCTG